MFSQTSAMQGVRGIEYKENDHQEDGKEKNLAVSEKEVHAFTYVCIRESHITRNSGSVHKLQNI